MRKVSFLVLFLFSTVIFSEESAPISKIGAQHKSGAYKNFKEFLQNNPSLQERFIFDNQIKTPMNRYVLPSEALTYVTRRNKVKEYTKSMWGYCNGQREVFILHSGYFCKVTIGPRYSYFRYTPVGESRHSSGSYIDHTGRSRSTMMLNLSAGKVKHYVIDMKTGKVKKLTKRRMKKVLVGEYEELLSKYTEERDKEGFETMYTYLDKCNDMWRKENE